MFAKKKNATKDNPSSSMDRNKITIPLCDYSDLIAKETILEQVATVVAKDDSEYGTVAILRAILQINTPKK